jgi:mRNA-degrading endonuclease RelE of RelBE toxin-antitoxin system
LKQSRTTRQFWRLLSDLPSDVQRDAKRAYRLFETNPAHPGLQFKKLEGEDDIYSARIGLDYRALAVVKRNRVVWFWIGSHADYDRIV